MSPDDPPLTPERWRRIQELYHGVKAHPPEARVAALAAACQDDPVLSAAVQLLLDQPDSAAGFLSHPALGPSAPLDAPATLRPAGSRLGNFELLGLAGMGGMGEVYRALDTKLQRTVAIKVLPGEFTNDPERVARFEREARVLASLNHPNIGTLYGVEEAGGVRALVLEFVEGETLAERIHGPRGRGSALPLADALSIARQIADGLEAAHERGFVHRDLKPANIMITHDGVVKVLDFGLAKLGGGGTQETSETATRGGTRDGAILGTAAYMSPEQARAKPLDKRTDIWAFGCVLYEMLTGRQAFGGETTSDAIAGVLGTEPDWTALPAATPAPVRRLLERCLRKDPKKRLRDIGDAVLDLTELDSPGVEPQARESRGVLVAVVVSLLVVAVIALLLRQFGTAPATARTSRFPIALPPVTFRVAISPDGRRLAYVAADRTRKPMLWVRSMDFMDGDGISLPGTEDARLPFWSPDSRWIAFYSQGKLKKVEASGGSSQVLTQTSGYQGGAWSRDGTILFSAGVIRRISESGGAVSDVTELDTSLREAAHAAPSFLPDGRHFLYQTRNDPPGTAAVYLGSLDSKSRKLLINANTVAVYAPPGFVLYGRAGALMARPFDPAGLEFTGEAVTLAEKFLLTTDGRGSFNASDDGTLSYMEGVVEPHGQWSWLNRTGNTLGAVGGANGAAVLRLSPDGTRVAFSEAAVGGADLWIHDLGRGIRTRVTTDPSENHYPVWSPDGSRLVFDSSRKHEPATHALYEAPANGATPETLFLDVERGATLGALDWSRDGRLIVFAKGQGTAPPSLWVLPLEGNRKPIPYLPIAKGEASLSPNGRWLAYTSDEEGVPQVILRSFPDPSGERRQISSNGGIHPRWRGDGKELYYLDSARQMIAVEMTAEKDLVIGKATPLFEAPFPFFRGASGPVFPYDVTADGQRFLVSAPTPASAVVVLNWAAGLNHQ